MSEQQVGAQARITERQRDGTDAVRPLQGELVVGIRVDTLPTGEADRLAEAGAFYPLTVNEHGELRVAVAGGAGGGTTATQDGRLQLLQETRSLLEEIRDLLLSIA